MIAPRTGCIDMRYRRLGTTGLFVSELPLGTMTFGTPEAKYAAAGGLEQREVEAIMDRAIKAGINFINTADVYSGGQADSALPMEYPGWMIANGSAERQALMDTGLRPRQER